MTIDYSNGILCLQCYFHRVKRRYCVIAAFLLVLLLLTAFNLFFSTASRQTSRRLLYFIPQSDEVNNVAVISAHRDVTVSSDAIGVRFNLSGDVTVSSDAIGARFNLSSCDVMVHLHIQKTGGSTFGRHLVRDLVVSPPCDCYKQQTTRKYIFRCSCPRDPPSGSSWLFSRYSVGWPCGVHPPLSHLAVCVPALLNNRRRRRAQLPAPADDEFNACRNNHRYFYVTMLRDPVQRFLSEWTHVRRGASWARGLGPCDSLHSRTGPSTRSCYSGQNWRGVSLREFLSCETNAAHNRQSWMLADANVSALSSQCHTVKGQFTEYLSVNDTGDAAATILKSARANLRRLAFFGLSERLEQSRRLFERTFGLNFSSTFIDKTNETKAATVGATIDSALLQRIRARNSIDLQLYKYAVGLFNHRLNLLSENPDLKSLPAKRLTVRE